MFKILRDYAVNTVWCCPNQDNQIILSPMRITKRVGDMVSTLVLTRRLALPLPKKYFHVYYVGQVPPGEFGLIPKVPVWTSSDWVNLMDVINDNALFADVYLANGVRIPLSRVYYQFTTDRALVFAIEDDKTVSFDSEKDQVYFRFYTNAFYTSSRAQNVLVDTRAVSARIYSMTDILSVQSTELQFRNEGLGVMSFVNGNLVEALTPMTVKIGDYVECLLDTSVKRVCDFRVADLKTFRSERDQSFKYLLHYPEESDPTIDYVDDIDVYVYFKTGTRVYGRYVNRNQRKTLRMVTHRDYSLLTETVASVILDLKEWTLANLGDAAEHGDYYVRLYIRNSGMDLTLPYENNRIFELYKLDEEGVMNALIGAESSLPIWKAANLENSDFIKLLDTPYTEIDIDLVEGAFGYNAISKVLADSPIKPTQSYNRPSLFQLPPGLQINSTIYEYSADGLLLGFYPHTSGALHIANNADCEIIEGVVGIGSHSPSVTYGTDNISIPAGCDYRVYMAYGQDTLATSPWEDVTGTDRYEVVDGVLKWLSPDEDYILMVRTDEKFLSYSLNVLPVAGTIYLPFTEVSGGLHRTVPVLPGDLDLWMNGHDLVQGVDYFIKDMTFHIVNKSYLVQPADTENQRITVRGTGFCDLSKKDRGIEVGDDYGFIEHGVLSNNSRYDIRDDRVMSFFVGGKLKHRDSLIYSEEHQGISVINATNGQIYRVKERVIPLRDLTYSQSKALREKSEAIDTAVSQYMTKQLPQPDRDAPSVIHRRHLLVSPFFSHLVSDLYTGKFPREKLQKRLQDQDVLNICKTYEHLLDNDPLNEELGLDYRFILIHPHNLDTTLSLDVESYSFLKHVVKLFGKNLISLSAHLTINAKED